MKQVALIYPYPVPWMGELLLGMAHYAKEHGEWAILTSPPPVSGTGEYALDLVHLPDWPGDGIITAVARPSELRAVQQLRFPCVNISGAIRDIPIPSVLADQFQTGRIAAEHLMECGFRRLAYYGIERLCFSNQRQGGFERRARETGISVEVYKEKPTPNTFTSWSERTSGLRSWLRTLELPVGLLAVHDYRARAVINECRQLGIEVPHQMAILGVDNDPTVCDYCRPSLSSISRDGYHQGYEAARLLDRLMAGEQVGADPILIPPVGVVMRKSTDTIVVEDSHVATVVRYIHEHVNKCFGVKKLLRLVPVSRRRLERQFRRYMHCTPYEYLLKFRVEKAKQLLCGPQPMKIQVAAKACGFPSAAQFRVVFKRLTRQNPRQYVTSHRKTV